MPKILSFLQSKKAVVIEEDVLGFEIEQFIKYKNIDVLKNLLVQYSNSLISPEFISFDNYYDQFESKFRHLFEATPARISDGEKGQSADNS